MVGRAFTFVGAVRSHLLLLLPIGLLLSGCEFGSVDNAMSLTAQSQNQQKQLGLVCKMYANESAGEYFPPLSPNAGHLMFAVSSALDSRDGIPMHVYPDYMVDATVLVHPGAPDAGMWARKAESDPVSVIDDQHYVYLGFAVQDDAAMDGFTEAYLNAVNSGGVPTSDLEHDGETFHRLREGVERGFLTGSSGPAQAAEKRAEIPVIVERRVFSDGKANVLFMDGHVERIPQGRFPNTDAFWANVARINDKK